MVSSEKIEAKFARLLSEGEAALHKAGWDGDSYKKRFPDDIEYRQFRTEALNLVRIVCGSQSDHYQELLRIAEGEGSASNSFYFKDCLGILRAAKRDFDDDLLSDLKAVVAAEVLGEFIDQADALLEAGYYVAAASVAGAVLEDAMRKLCVANNLAVAEKTTISALNADLGRAGVIDKLVHKRITLLAEVRNNADHGHFEKVSQEDVDDLVRYARKFCADYLVHPGR